MKKAYKVLSTAALAATMLGGAAWGNAEAAATKTAVTKTAVQKTENSKQAVIASATQGEITLSATKAIHDGNHIQIIIERSGKELSGEITGKYDPELEDVIYAEGAINNLDVLIDGKPLHSLGNALADRPDLRWGTVGNDAIQISLSDASWLGKNIKPLPDKFKLTANVYLEGTKKPFKLNIPIQKSAEKPVVLQPNVTKTSGKMTMTLKKAALMSTSSRVQLILKGYEKNREEYQSISYDFVDDQGNKLEMISARGTDENNKNDDMYYDFILEKLDKDVKSITLKPYKPEFIEGNSGPYKLDSDGNVIKHYIEDLEMTFSVK
ncbi:MULTISPECIES: DUF5643 domain-containing protein [Paenibacillus]|uniref:DUF5643 domain-containing protein n=1 Tax=Paenibacillus TaxID=44249 RepID=UPI00188C3D07|nr:MULTISPECIES: DUF5643 domain-containing protein [Paenibacillus]MBX4151943.1 hypothetical protein [Paenibacillus lautus]